MGLIILPTKVSGA